MLLKYRPILIFTVLALFLSITQSTGMPVLAQAVASGPNGIEGQTSLMSVAPMAAVPGGPGFFAVSAFSFMPFTPANLPAYSVQAIYNPGTALSYFEAPISLPHGANVTQIVIYFYDNDTSDLTAGLYMCSYMSSGCTTMVAVSSTGALDGNRELSSTTVTNPIIDLSSNSYVIQLALPPTANVKLYGVRVDYSYPTFLPTVMKVP